MPRVILATAAILVAVNSAWPSEIERWTCHDVYGPTTWTIAENRMFVAKGKGSLQVVSNTPTATVAYSLTLRGGSAISWVLMLDKVGHKLIEYDDSVAAIFKGTYSEPIEPKITTLDCERQNAN